MAEAIIPRDHMFHSQNPSWKLDAVSVYIEKVDKIDELEKHISTLFETKIESGEKTDEVLGWDSTPKIKIFLKGEVEELVLKEQEFVTVEQFNSWGKFIKSELKIKGKNLFMGMRVLLTGSVEGSDLKNVIPVTPVKILYKRLYGEK